MEPNTPVNPTQLKKNHARRITWRPLGLIILLLTIVVLGTIFYQTYQAETALKLAQTNTIKGDYRQARTQLAQIHTILVWPTTLKKIAQAKAQNDRFENDAKNLRLANIFIASQLLNDAAATLSKINTNFPDYAKVIALQKIIAEQKAVEAKQAKADVSPLPGPIEVRGDATCRSTTQAALQLLSTKAPAHHAIVKGYIGIIECVNQGTRMYAEGTSPRTTIGDTTRNVGTIWYAGVLVHEASHSKQFRDYKAAHPGQPVPNNAWQGEAAEKSCLDTQYDALVKLGATPFHLESVKTALATKYYEVPIEQQWW